MTNTKLILKYTTCTCSAPCPCAAAFLEVQRVGLWSQTWKGRSAAGHQTRASRNQTSPASLPCSRWPTSAGTKRGRRWWGGSRAYSMHANVTWVIRNLRSNWFTLKRKNMILQRCEIPLKKNKFYNMWGSREGRHEAKGPGWNPTTVNWDAHSSWVTGHPCSSPCRDVSTGLFYGCLHIKDKCQLVNSPYLL